MEIFIIMCMSNWQYTWYFYEIIYTKKQSSFHIYTIDKTTHRQTLHKNNYTLWNHVKEQYHKAIHCKVCFKNHKWTSLVLGWWLTRCIVIASWWINQKYSIQALWHLWPWVCISPRVLSCSRIPSRIVSQMHTYLFKF